MPADQALARIHCLEATQSYLVVSPRPDGEPALLAAGLAQAVEAGVRAVQLRLKDGTTSARRAWLAACRERLPAEVLLLVNDDLEAVFHEDGRPLADGVHLGREDAAALGGDDGAPASGRRTAAGLLAARRRLGPDLLLGTSTRTEAEVRSAIGAMASTLEDSQDP